MKNAYSLHAARVATVSAQMRGFWERKQKVRIYHGSTNSTRPFNLKAGEVVDVSSLTHVLELNLAEGWITVEANVPMDVLVRAAGKRGYAPLVVPEFPGITVAGAIQGGAGESSSFRWGGFHETCLEYEMVLATGEVVTASPTENKDLYWGTACSYGTLGIITMAKLKLRNAEPYVRLTYYPTGTAQETIAEVRRWARKEVDFVDSIQCTPSTGVVMVGRYGKKASLPTARFLRARDEWFYLHAQAQASRKQPYEELIPLKDYFFRYDRGAFWTGTYVFERLGLPFTRLARMALTPWFRTRTLYKLLHAVQGSQLALVQDICFPEENFNEFITYLDKKFAIYPLWFCPLKVNKEGQDKLSPTRLQADMAINVGVWGKFAVSHAEFIRGNQEVEGETHRLGGRKVLYAHAYYSEEDFWKIYDKGWYAKLRERYQAVEVFPSIYEKVIVRERLQPSRRGIAKALFGSPFALKKKAGTR